MVTTSQDEYLIIAAKNGAEIKELQWIVNSLLCYTVLTALW